MKIAIEIFPSDQDYTIQQKIMDQIRLLIDVNDWNRKNQIVVVEVLEKK